MNKVFFYGCHFFLPEIFIFILYLSICFNLAGEKPGGGGVLPCMGYIGMCKSHLVWGPLEGYGFQAVYSVACKAGVFWSAIHELF